MSDEATGGTPSLNKALAGVQAELPKITKDETANVQGKEGKQGYKYSYADLAAISEAALPLLGRHGLAFTAWPTLIDGKFVLIYELLHESGEQKGGVFPLVSSGKPQELGGLITYYRRYALCAVTGIAPAGEDDDAASANHTQQYDTRSAGAAFENAAARPPAATDQKWLAAAAAGAGNFATDADGRKLWREVAAALAGGKCSKDEADLLGNTMKARFAELAAEAPAAPEGEPVEGVIVAEPLDPEDAWAAKVEDITSEEDAGAALADLRVTAKANNMPRDVIDRIASAIRAKAASLGQEAA